MRRVSCSDLSARSASATPAKSIAQAAKEFGQEDDITVLSITRTVGLNLALAIIPPALSTPFNRAFRSR